MQEESKLLDTVLDSEIPNPKNHLKLIQSSSSPLKTQSGPKPIDLDQKITKSLKQESKYLSSKFWKKSTSWQKRKEIAKDFLKNKSFTQEQYMHKLAYKGKLSKITETENQKINSEAVEQYNETEFENLEEDSLRYFDLRSDSRSLKEKLYTKNPLGLTPLIYAIWGEEDRKDSEKKTSKFIITEALKINGTKDKYESSLNKFEYTPIDDEFKNELGHATLHSLIGDGSFKYNIVTKDFDESLAYIIESEGLKMKKFEIKHSVVNKKKKLSILAFAIKVKAIQCINLMFSKIIDLIKDPKNYIFSALEDELPDYIGFNSPLIEKMLNGIITIKDKSFPTDKDMLPVTEMVSSDADSIEFFAFTRFDESKEKNDFIKGQVFNTKIRLPSLMGGPKSLKFLQNLLSSENLALFRNTLVKRFIDYKWNLVLWLVMIHSLVMWGNIVLLVLIVFVYGDTQALLGLFTLVNGFLAAFTFFKISSMSLYQFLGNVDKTHFAVGMRVFTLGFLFIPNFQPYSTVVYSFFSAVLSAKSNKRKREVLKNWLVFGIYIGVLFSGFWADWEGNWYLMIGYGSTAVLIIYCLARYSVMRAVITCSRFIEGAALVTVICTDPVNFSVLILTQFLLGFIFLSEFLLYLIDEGRGLMSLIDCLKTVVFSINFYTSGDTAFYTVNSLSLFFGICSVFYNILVLEEMHKDKFVFRYSFLTISLIALNTKDYIAQKIIVICLEALFVVVAILFETINLKKIYSNFLLMVVNWNSIELARVVLVIIWLVTRFKEKPNLDLTYALIILTLIKGLTSFRCIKLTRYYVRLIIDVAKDVFPFLIIFFYSTLSFGILCAVNKTGPLADLWMYSYDINVKSFSHSPSLDINYVIFFIATVINVFILLNLLISILNDSFDKFHVISSEIDYLEMTETIIEFESVWFWNRRKEDYGKFLIGIMDEKILKSKQGKITKTEYVKVKEGINLVFNDVQKGFADCENRICSKVEKRVEEFKAKIIGNIENIVRMRNS